ncbi:hypothetical protein ACQP00_16610 [Dactylosporangium sp. CS-047395]|uniref:hypothetical protein n=1 Tax=Dactylosporangium sp. CS-047395 TaxID=3239936 RepID=UPI003D8C07C9
MAVVAEQFDVVVGGDTHLDTHTLEMASPAGVPLATLQISNDADGFAAALAWIAELAPGPRVLVA